MAVLTAAGRKRIKPKNFAVPGKNGYPIQDESHARNALARVAQHGSPAEQAQVRRAVGRKYPGIEQSKGSQAKNGKKANGNGNPNGNGRNGNGSNAVAKRAVSELGRRLDARDRR